jgi:hypothetical protein
MCAISCAANIHAAESTAPKAVRDPLKQPFASTSIWNMPIGRNAVYVAAGLPTVPGGDKWAPMPDTDEEIIVLDPGAPLAKVYYSDAAWTGKNRCQPTGAVIAEVPIPAGYLVPHNSTNNSAAFLAPDGHTLINVQPFTRCSAAHATSLVKFPSTDLYGDGRIGAHGGSSLSAIGGSLRLGELRPGGEPPRHALKVNVYAKQALFPCKTKTACYTWPASSADGYAIGHYGIRNPKADPLMKMGALLAIPAQVDLARLGLETQPAKMLAWTLQNYGAYIVDDTWSPSFAINVETGPNGSFRKQFRDDWGFPLNQRVNDDTPWVRDMQRLVAALAVVANNGPDSIGGGGEPLQPLAPELRPQMDIGQRSDKASAPVCAVCPTR